MVWGICGILRRQINKQRKMDAQEAKSAESKKSIAEEEMNG